jgi:hypothetical protein
MALIVKVFAAHKSIKKQMPLILQKIKNEENDLKRQNKTLKNPIQFPNIIYYYKKNFKKFKGTYMEMAFVVIVVATQKTQKNSGFDLAKIKKKKRKKNSLSNF